MIASNREGLPLFRYHTCCNYLSLKTYLHIFPTLFYQISHIKNLKCKWHSSKLTAVCVSCVGLWGPPMTRFCRCCGYCLRLVLGECPGLGPCESWGEPPNENLPICREDRLVGESVDGLTAWGLCTSKSTSCINKSSLHEIAVYNTNIFFSVYALWENNKQGVSSVKDNSQFQQIIQNNYKARYEVLQRFIVVFAFLFFCIC
jgi:hypothetical protein